jgi:hypothetical protein
MSNLETLFSFIVVMTILMIPTVAILKRNPKRGPGGEAELARRVEELEAKQLARERELMDLRREVAFMQRLVESRPRDGAL